MVKRTREPGEPQERERFTWRDADAPDERDFQRWPILLKFDDIDGRDNIIYFDQMLQVLWRRITLVESGTTIVHEWQVTSLLQLG